MSKKQGNVNIKKHMIGDRKPIMMFLGLGAVATLTGCDVNEEPYYAFTNMNTCDKQLPGQCDAAYKEAEKEAKRTALKYMIESECTRDFGRNNCLVDEQGAWYPKMAGFITHKDENNNFTQPFFTTANPAQKLYGQAFMANGREITELRDMDGLNLRLGGTYAKPLPSSKLDLSSISVEPVSGASGDTSNPGSSYAGNAGGTGSSATSLANSLLTGYLISEAIDETGDYLKERERTKRYQQCLKSHRYDCNSYTVTSGTGRVSGVNNSNRYRTYKSPSKLEKVAKANNRNSYSSSPTKATKASGGFGSTGRSLGGYGG